MHLEAARVHQRAGNAERALESAQLAETASTDEHTRAEALRQQSIAYRALADWERALATAAGSAEIATRLGDTNLYAEALTSESLVYFQRGEYDRTVELMTRVAGIAPTDRLKGVTYLNLGAVAAERRDFQEAERYLRQSNVHFEAAGYVEGQLVSLNNAARALLEQSRAAEAIQPLDRAIGLGVRENLPHFVALATLNRAKAWAALGQAARADADAAAALGHFKAAGDQWRTIECYKVLGELYLERELRDSAVRCYTQALALATRIGAGAEEIDLEARLQAIREKGDGPPAEE